MIDMDRLMGEFENGTLLRPSVDIPNSVDLSRAMARMCGHQRQRADSGSEIEIADLIGPAEHFVFVIVDGLGMSILETLPEEAFLRRNLACELRSVFPSTTSAALTTLATGTWPVNHAVIGWWTHFPEIPGPATVLPFIDRVTGTPLGKQGINAEMVFPIPSQVSSFDRSAIGILPKNLIGSVYSGYSLGRSIRRGYGTVAEGIDITLSRLESTTRPSYTYLYFPQVDSAAHMTGVHSEATQAALRDVNHGLERLARDMRNGTKIVVTADHGHLDAAPREPLLIQQEDEIGSMLSCPPSGDARVNYYHVREDSKKRFPSVYREIMPSNVLFLTPDEVQKLQLLGPGEIPTVTRERMGDYMAICTDSAIFAWAAAGTGGPDLSRLVSHHSGLSPDEVLIPLIVAS